MSCRGVRPVSGLHAPTPVREQPACSLLRSGNHKNSTRPDGSASLDPPPLSRDSDAEIDQRGPHRLQRSATRTGLGGTDDDKNPAQLSPRPHRRHRLAAGLDRLHASRGRPVGRCATDGNSLWRGISRRTTTSALLHARGAAGRNLDVRDVAAVLARGLDHRAAVRRRTRPLRRQPRRA